MASVNFISRAKLEGLDSEEKLDFILNEVKKGQILVLEKGLTAEEQAKLIEMTMKKINEKFAGIEMESYVNEKPTFLERIFGRKKVRLTIIGPADKIKTIYKDKDIIKAVIK
ncbi:MAG: DUF2073 domain-containing protein [Thermoplasmata archaeon]|nr:DUF2073 domain-containing protein [Thermoplasmata archaeon]